MKNMQLLIHEAGNAAQLCRSCGTDPTYISQIVTGVTTPTGAVRGIGDKLARKLEAGMSKPRGWMDVVHVPDLDPNVLALARAIESLPTDKKGHLSAVVDAFTQSLAASWDGVTERRKTRN